MDELEEKLGAILNDPKMMQNIMAMAQSLSQDPGTQAKSGAGNSGMEFDAAMFQKLGSMANSASIDPSQKQLLNALSPFVNQSRVSKLEKAMRAAKMAKLASTFLNSGGLQLLGGR